MADDDYRTFLSCVCGPLETRWGDGQSAAWAISGRGAGLIRAEPPTRQRADGPTGRRLCDGPLGDTDRAAPVDPRRPAGRVGSKRSHLVASIRRHCTMGGAQPRRRSIRAPVGFANETSSPCPTPI